MSVLTMDRRDTDASAIAIVVATIVVSVLCYAFILHAGIVLAE